MPEGFEPMQQWARGLSKGRCQKVSSPCKWARGPIMGRCQKVSSPLEKPWVGTNPGGIGRMRDAVHGQTTLVERLSVIKTYSQRKVWHCVTLIEYVGLFCTWLSERGWTFKLSPTKIWRDHKKRPQSPRIDFPHMNYIQFAEFSTKLGPSHIQERFQN